jgi:hypothetical protein
MSLPLLLLAVGVTLVAVSVAPTLRARRRPQPPAPRPTPAAAPRPAPAPRPATAPHASPDDVGALLDGLLGAHGTPEPPAAVVDEPAPIEDPRRIAEVLRFWLRDK